MHKRTRTKISYATNADPMKMTTYAAFIPSLPRPKLLSRCLRARTCDTRGTWVSVHAHHTQHPQFVHAETHPQNHARAHTAYWRPRTHAHTSPHKHTRARLHRLWHTRTLTHTQMHTHTHTHTPTHTHTTNTPKHPKSDCMCMYCMCVVGGITHIDWACVRVCASRPCRHSPATAPRCAEGRSRELST